MLYFLGYYGNNDARVINVSPASEAVTSYFLSALCDDSNIEITVVSPAHYTDKSIRHNTKSDRFNYVVPPFSAQKNVLIRRFSSFFRRIWCYEYLKHNVVSGEVIIVYHSLSFKNQIKKIKKYCDCKIIYIVNEIYSDVIGNGKKRYQEIESLNTADGYVFPTALLSKAINKTNQPEIILHGTYQAEIDRNVRFNDGKIHIVYAGTFDPRKGGAAAAAAAAYLDNRYHIHIIGFGKDEDKQQLLKVIEETKEKTECMITYDGLKSGEEYIRFIQSCDIGLSTQNPDTDFSLTSFPSKVLSYLSNGLRVVSIRIDTLVQSSVNDLIYYYEKNTAESIAKVIRSIDMNMPYDSRAQIEKLDNCFRRELLDLIQRI